MRLYGSVFAYVCHFSSMQVISVCVSCNQSTWQRQWQCPAVSSAAQTNHRSCWDSTFAFLPLVVDLMPRQPFFWKIWTGGICRKIHLLCGVFEQAGRKSTQIFHMHLSHHPCMWLILVEQLKFIQALAIKLILVLLNQNQNDLKQDHLKTAESEPLDLVWPKT